MGTNADDDARRSLVADPTAQTVTAGSRLRWTLGDLLPNEITEPLLGSGAPFEMRPEPVLGVPIEVFVQRPARLTEVFDRAVAEHGDGPALHHPDGTLTWSELRDLADRTATVLAGRHGVGAGDRVAIASANRVEYVVVFWAAQRLGAVVAGLNGWWVADELDHGIGLVDPRVVLADDARLERLDGRVPDVPRHSLSALVEEAGSANPLPAASHGTPAEDDPAVILFTSGTTGRPKGATLSHRNLLHFPHVNHLKAAIGAAFTGASRSTGQPVAICGGPLFHISGLIAILSAPWSGGAVVLPPVGRWDPVTHLRLTEEHGVSQWSGVPTMLWRLLEDPSFADRDLSSLRTIGVGGTNFPPELIRDLTAALPAVTLANGYGASETAGLGTGIAGPVIVAKPDSVGDANPTVEVELRDAVGRVVPDGEVGEICLRHASVFLGYWGDPDATAAVLDEDRWYRTGDYGRIVDGLVHLESRMRDLIIRGGENVYPIEVENRLVEHPGVLEAAVVGIADRLLGQRVVAAVVLHDGVSVTGDELRTWAADGLAAFKVPERVEIRAELPTTESGKVQKHLLEQEMAG